MVFVMGGDPVKLSVVVSPEARARLLEFDAGKGVA